MLDRELMQSAKDELMELRGKLLEARVKADTSHPRYQSLLNLKQYLLLRSRDVSNPSASRTDRVRF